MLISDSAYHRQKRWSLLIYPKCRVHAAPGQPLVRLDILAREFHREPYEN